MRRVILESPFRGSILANIAYARECLRDSLARGEAPLASHLLYTQPGLLNDELESQRQQGIAAGHAWIAFADALVVYTDYEITEGMQAAINLAGRTKTPIEFRKILSSKEGNKCQSKNS